MSVIKEIRDKTGLSQYKLAEWLGVSRGMINLAEKEKRKLSHKASMKLTAISILLSQMGNR